MSEASKSSDQASSKIAQNVLNTSQEIREAGLSSDQLTQKLTSADKYWTFMITNSAQLDPESLKTICHLHTMAINSSKEEGNGTSVDLVIEFVRLIYNYLIVGNNWDGVMNPKLPQKILACRKADLNEVLSDLIRGLTKETIGSSRNALKKTIDGFIDGLRDVSNTLNSHFATSGGFIEKRYIENMRSFTKSSAEAVGLSGCFIATALYDCRDTDKLELLRYFRDEHILRYKFGHSIISYYYKYSPPIADYLSENQTLGYLTRILFLEPIIRIIKFNDQPNPRGPHNHAPPKEIPNNCINKDECQLV